MWIQYHQCQSSGIKACPRLVLEVRISPLLFAGIGVAAPRPRNNKETRKVNFFGEAAIINQFHNQADHGPDR